MLQHLAALISPNTEHLSKADPVMARLVSRLGPFTLKPRQLPPFQSLVQSIIYQQLSGKAAATILARFQALFGDGRFPTPQEVLAISSERLRSAGLSRPKASYVRGVAEHSVAGRLPTLISCAQLTDAEIIERLTEIKGVGRWTAEIFLMFNLGRPDVLPVHDLGVRKGFQIAYGKRALPEPGPLERFGQKWKPHRTTAAWYLWRAVDSL
jgi:DNA-3-methyladenine glycosylase II